MAGDARKNLRRGGSPGRPKGSKNSPLVKNQPFTRERQQLYCAELQRHGEPAAARVMVGLAESTVRHQETVNPEFASMVAEAMHIYRSRLAQEIDRRAVEGWDEPVYHMGMLVGYKRRYSDTLLLAQAKRHNPEYRDSIKVDQTTHVDGGLGLALEQLSDQSRELLRKIIEIEAGDGHQEEAGEA